MRTTIDDLLNTYVEAIKRILDLDNDKLIESKLQEIDKLTIQPMMIMYRKLPIDVRRQFLKSKIGNVKQNIDLTLTVELRLKLPQ